MRLVAIFIIIAIIVVIGAVVVAIYLINSGNKRLRQELAETKAELRLIERVTDKATAGLMQISSGMAGNAQITAMATLDEVNAMKQQVEPTR